ncbi:MAG TPA: Na+/H+ antiporter subunit B [Candidatus Binatia bacterium]
MTSLILSTASRLLLPLFLAFSIFILLRGHNEPGGGFVGGLIAAAAFALHAIAYDVEKTRSLLAINPRGLIVLGLFLAMSSGMISLFIGEPFLTGQWVKISFGSIGELDLGTPLFFDIGVYLTVIGVTLTIILSLAEE